MTKEIKSAKDIGDAIRENSIAVGFGIPVPVEEVDRYTDDWLPRWNLLNRLRWTSKKRK